MKRAKKKILLFLLMIGISVTADFRMAYAAEGTDELAGSYLEELDLKELQSSIDEMFPEYDFDFRDSIAELLRGEIPLRRDTLLEFLKEAAFSELSNQKNMVLQILVLAIAAAVFSNFVKIFEKNQISEIAFYMIYLLLFVILMKAFGDLGRMAENNLQQMLHFMKLLLPTYLVVASLAAGSLTAIGFYELTLVFIAAAQALMTYIVLPGIRFYVLFLLLNHLGREELFSKLAELIHLALSWILKTLFALVVGVQTVQALLLPAIDSLKNSVWTKATGALPVLGNTLNAVTETVLGTAVLLKNAVGVAGLLVIVLICLAPVVRLLVCTFLYKAVGAAVQPVSDKRITECISGVGEGAALLLKTVSVTGVTFLITLALVTASIRGV
ncbi:putative stage III sporulation protein AE [Marvinbryantia formatexigens DSM 14469]|uniref:Stage III sporulation protein AE n=1 Tax=Marvinbryantia formatexigens DSM 14469 TaxID=478749 RepID=C6LAD1_9FIRM|nr:stage III sporulation protein AE [Marvinbryantia formatexigens]EET62538.1 putative stage III sporulation protein AE [Marvinbryantia formatexigens DSM 14469]UWO24941.1 stage III sporulation protein AE [Marvinbryantia formatexigens DSM 14469]SDG24629.1 stage III sporulation protein AE [Marvinbryantia formatexigens]